MTVLDQLAWRASATTDRSALAWLIEEPLPSWVVEEDAQLILHHLLRGEPPALRWDLAPWWRTKPGLIPPPGAMTKGNFALGKGTPASTPALNPAVAKAIPLVPNAPSSPLSEFWAALEKVCGGQPWLAKYHRYFNPGYGAPATLEGVLDTGSTREIISLYKQTMQIDAGKRAYSTVSIPTVAYVLAVALEVLEESAPSNSPPSGYPSTWESPQPPAARWISPVTRDTRFFDEFDIPPSRPLLDSDRYRNGLSFEEASRVWARRLAVALWTDANEHWPWRLSTLSIAMRRLLLRWDPGVKPPDATEANYRMAVGQTFYQFAPGRYHLGNLWDTNPYLAWLAVRCGVAMVPGVGRRDGVLAWTDWLRRSGFHHRSGSICRGPTSPNGNAEVVYRGKLPGNRIGRLGEVLDANFSGCQASVYAFIGLLRGMNVPACAVSLDFHSFRTTQLLPATNTYVHDASVELEGAHHGLLCPSDDVMLAQFHADDINAHTGQRYGRPGTAWIPWPEVLLAGIWTYSPPEPAFQTASTSFWLARIMAAREFDHARQSALGLPSRFKEYRALDAATDQKLAKAGAIPPFATRRGEWSERVVYTLTKARQFSWKGQTIPGGWVGKVGAVLDLASGQPCADYLKHRGALDKAAGIAEYRRLAAEFLGIDNDWSHGVKPDLKDPWAPKGQYQSGDQDPENRSFSKRGQLPANWSVQENGGASRVLSDGPEVIEALLELGILLWKEQNP
jgi:hypothetical protein